MQWMGRVFEEAREVGSWYEKAGVCGSRDSRPGLRYYRTCAERVRTAMLAEVLRVQRSQPECPWKYSRVWICEEDLVWNDVRWFQSCD
jgi:hypothetical protein